MATLTLIQLFEDVRTGKNGITTQNKNIAKENAEWFYKNSKEIEPTKTDSEIENDATQLINFILRNKSSLVQKFNEKVNSIKTDNNTIKKGEKKLSVPTLEALLGKYVMNNLDKHFKLIMNPEEFILLTKYQIALDTIKKLFPDWKKINEYKTVLSIFYLSYSSYLKNDENAIIDRITKVWEIATKSKPINLITPAYIITIIKRNSSLHKMDENDKNIIYVSEYPAFEGLINLLIADNQNASPDKVGDFWNWIQSFGSLSGKEKELIEIFIKEADKHSSYKEYYEACKKIFMENDGAYSNFRTILSRIRDKINNDKNKGSRDMLQFIPGTNWKYEQILQSINLKASDENRDKINDFDDDLIDKDLEHILSDSSLYMIENDYTQEDYDEDKRSDEQIIYDEILKQLEELFNKNTNLSIEDIVNQILGILSPIISELIDEDLENDEPTIYIDKNDLFILINRVLEELLSKRKINIETFCKVVERLNVYF